MNLGFRLYDPVIGRFLSVDPLFEMQIGINPYHYCYNDPVNASDPSGLIARSRDVLVTVSAWIDDFSDEIEKNNNLIISIKKHHAEVEGSPRRDAPKKLGATGGGSDYTFKLIEGQSGPDRSWEVNNIANNISAHLFAIQQSTKYDANEWGCTIGSRFGSFEAFHGFDLHTDYSHDNVSINFNAEYLIYGYVHDHGMSKMGDPSSCFSAGDFLAPATVMAEHSNIFTQNPTFFLVLQDCIYAAYVVDKEAFVNWFKKEKKYFDSKFTGSFLNYMNENSKNLISGRIGNGQVSIEDAMVQHFKGIGINFYKRTR